MPAWVRALRRPLVPVGRAWRALLVELLGEPRRELQQLVRRRLPVDAFAAAGRDPCHLALRVVADLTWRPFDYN